MALKQTNMALGITPQPTPKGSEEIAFRIEYDSAVGGALANGDVIEFCFLPEDCLPVDWSLDVDDLDSNGSPTIAFGVGLLNAGKTAVSTAGADGGAAWAAAQTTAQAGGVLRPSTVATWRCSPLTTRRSVGLVLTAGPATFQAGKVGFTFCYRQAYQGK